MAEVWEARRRRWTIVWWCCSSPWAAVVVRVATVQQCSIIDERLVLVGCRRAHRRGGHAAWCGAEAVLLCDVVAVVRRHLLSRDSALSLQRERCVIRCQKVSQETLPRCAKHGLVFEVVADPCFCESLERGLLQLGRPRAGFDGRTSMANFQFFTSPAPRHISGKKSLALPTANRSRKRKKNAPDREPKATEISHVTSHESANDKNMYIYILHATQPEPTASREPLRESNSHTPDRPSAEVSLSRYISTDRKMKVL